MMVAAGTITSTIDISGMKSFARKLRDVSPPTARLVRTIIVEAGGLVKEEADKRAKEIMPGNPPKITVSVSGVMAQIKAKGAVAKLFEAGGKGGKAGHPARWRHPTGWQNPKGGPWVDQDTQPYLVPALQSTREEVVSRMIERINVVMDEYLGGVFDAEGGHI